MLILGSWKSDTKLTRFDGWRQEETEEGAITSCYSGLGVNWDLGFEPRLNDPESGLASSTILHVVPIKQAQSIMRNTFAPTAD